MYVVVDRVWVGVRCVSRNVCVDLERMNEWMMWWFFFQAEDGIRDLVRSRGLGDVYKRQHQIQTVARRSLANRPTNFSSQTCQALSRKTISLSSCTCLLYTSDAADERSSVDLGGRRIIKKKNNTNEQETQH